MNDLVKAPLNSLLVALAIMASSAFAAERDAAGSPKPTPFFVYRSFDEMAKATDPVLPLVRAVPRGPKFQEFRGNRRTPPRDGTLASSATK
jgi:hypothetical protein